jgi:hypothetical protein
MKEINVESSAGKKYGHVPGHQYHDVDVTIDRSAAGRWTVEIIETWGSCQGRDEEHGRKTVMACGRSLEEAVEKVTARAEGADINRSYLVQALSCAEAEAAEVEEALRDEEQHRKGFGELSQVATELLIAELRSRGGAAA